MKHKAVDRWTEASISQAVVRKHFHRDVLAVPCCNWVGSECDLLVIDKRSLRIIDVEVKISRSDLRADWFKAKWWYSRPWNPKPYKQALRHNRPRQWPEKVWKHYYVMPASIWDDKLLADIHETSGVILVTGNRESPGLRVVRPAKPCREAKPISAADAIDIARLAGLRMWSALSKESHHEN